MVGEVVGQHGADEVGELLLLLEAVELCVHLGRTAGPTGEVSKGKAQLEISRAASQHKNNPKQASCLKMRTDSKRP